MKDEIEGGFIFLNSVFRFSGIPEHASFCALYIQFEFNFFSLYGMDRKFKV